jgi:aminoglycoside 6'-N-acetyltransferase
MCRTFRDAVMGFGKRPAGGKELGIQMIVLRGERVLLRPGRPEDAEELVRIRNEPEVARRWGSADTEEEVREEFIGTDEGFVIEVDGQVVGAIQYHEENDPMYRHAGMDIFLTISRHGEALGTEAIRVLARHLFEERGHHRLTIDPAADNAAAIRAYEKVGFRRVGILRNYERGPDGVWHDGLLMDMLKEEFRS